MFLKSPSCFSGAGTGEVRNQLQKKLVFLKSSQKEVEASDLVNVVKRDINQPVFEKSGRCRFYQDVGGQETFRGKCQEGVKMYVLVHILYGQQKMGRIRVNAS